MARIRTLKPEAWQDRALGTCSREARLLWVVLVTFADDDGRFIATPGTIFGHGYPHDVEALTCLPGWLTELHRAGLIRLYEDGGESFGVIPSWVNHQKISHATPSRLPKPPESDGEVPESSGNIPETSGTPAPIDDPADSGNIPEDSGEVPPSTTDHLPPTYDQGSGGGGAANVFDALAAAGFDRLAVETDAAAIRQTLSEHEVPADVDWWRVGQDIRKKREAGVIRAERPLGALRFVLRGVTGLPRLGDEKPGRRATAADERSALTATYAAQAMGGIVGGGA